MKNYTCTNCLKPFKRYSSTVRNEDRVYCSKNCKNNHQKILLIGKNNPNYKTGQKDSICSCGNKKDFRAKKCSICSNIGFPKKGIIKYTKEQLIKSIQENNTIEKAAKQLGIGRETLSKIIKKENINISHFKKTRYREYKLDEILILGHKRNNQIVKKLIIKNNLIKYKCNSCGQLPEWNTKKLILELDHINGNALDNRLENLRFLCPNCHSQTETYTGKNMKKKLETKGVTGEIE